MPILVVLAVIFGEGGHLEGAPVIYGWAFGALLSVPATVWFVRKQFIALSDDRILFSFTRYVMPKRRELRYDQTAKIVFHDGILARDGRPRPYLEAFRKDGSWFWVPLPIFGRRDLGIMLDKLTSAGVPIEIKRGGRFVTGGRKNKIRRR